MPFAQFFYDIQVCIYQYSLRQTATIVAMKIHMKHFGCTMQFEMKHDIYFVYLHNLMKNSPFR